MIRRAYQTYFHDDPKQKFDKTLFRFLLGRLGRHNDPFAYPHALQTLPTHPEETQAVLDYVERIGAAAISDEAIRDFLLSPLAVYSYQVYQILTWRCGLSYSPDDGLRRFVRQQVFHERIPPYLMSTCREFLGKWGSESDLDGLEARFNEVRDDLGKGEIVCCLRRLESGKRNAFLGRVRSDGPFTERAVRFVREGNV